MRPHRCNDALNAADIAHRIDIAVAAHHGLLYCVAAHLLHVLVDAVARQRRHDGDHGARSGGARLVLHTGGGAKVAESVRTRALHLRVGGKGAHGGGYKLHRAGGAGARAIRLVARRQRRKQLRTASLQRRMPRVAPHRHDDVRHLVSGDNDSTLQHQLQQRVAHVHERFGVSVRVCELLNKP